MEANLKYTQKVIVLSSLTTSTLDYLDGLTIKDRKFLVFSYLFMVFL